MIRFLVDADLPRSVAPALRSRGYEAVDVRDVELAAASDLRVFRYAVTHRCTLVSGDRGFASILRFPLGTHHGLVVARFAPHTPAPKKVRILLRWLPSLAADDFEGNLVIVAPRGVRIRRHRD